VVIPDEDAALLDLFSQDVGQVMARYPHALRDGSPADEGPKPLRRVLHVPFDQGRVIEVAPLDGHVLHEFEKAKQHPAYWMEDLRLQFLNDIYEIMQEQKLAQKDLAEKMGVSEAYISKGFNGSEASQDRRLL